MLIGLLDIEGLFVVGIGVGVKALNGAVVVSFVDAQVFGPVEIKGYTLNGFAILVHLDDPLVEQGLEVEAQGQAGVVIAPLQVEHFQGVGGVAGEGVFPLCPLDGLRIFGERKFLLQGGTLCQDLFVSKHPLNVHRTVAVFGEAVGLPALAHGDFAGGEVDHAIDFAVGAAQVQHQHIVDKHPHVVVAGEGEGHGLGAYAGVDHAVGGLAEVHLHSHAQVVVHIPAGFRFVVAALNILTAGKLSVFQSVEHLAGGVEGEEVANAAAACKAAVAVAVVGAVHCGGVVEDKLTVAGHTVDVCSPSLLELGKIFPHVVEVVALVVDLKQALHILKGAFVGLVSIQIEQIVKGVAVVGVPPIVIYSIADILLIFRVAESAGKLVSRVAAVKLVAGKFPVGDTLISIDTLIIHVGIDDRIAVFSQRVFHNSSHSGMCLAVIGARAGPLVPKSGVNQAVSK